MSLENEGTGAKLAPPNAYSRYSANASEGGLQSYHTPYDQPSGCAFQNRNPENQRDLPSIQRRQFLRISTSPIAKATRIAAEEMLKHRSNNDLIELSNAGFDLLRCLNELWKLRDQREDDWGDLINLVQGTLEKLEFELLSPPQCKALKTVIDEYVTSDVVTLGDLEFCVESLTANQFNPFRPISSPPVKSDAE